MILQIIIIESSVDVKEIVKHIFQENGFLPVDKFV